MRFVKIDPENYREIIGLKVSEDQEVFVMSNVKAMAAAYAYGELGKAYGIENEGQLVGMVMLRKYPPNNTYFLWHMMIDRKYQNLGIGKLAVEEVIKIAKEEGLGLVTTCFRGNDVALKLYQSYGFEVFQADEEEVDLRLSLKMHNEIQLVIFDMDGLMFDTEKISYKSWKTSAAIHGYEINWALFEQTLGTNMNRTKEIYTKYLGNEFPFDLVVAERVRISNEMIALEGVPIKNGLFELLNYLQKKNLKMAVATSTSRKRALNMIREAELEQYFDYILCGDEVVNSKPHPELFQKVAEKLGCEPSKCLVLEDSESGIKAAYRAGMLPIIVPDLKEPSKEIINLAIQRMDSLFEVMQFLNTFYSEK